MTDSDSSPTATAETASSTPPPSNGDRRRSKASRTPRGGSRVYAKKKSRGQRSLPPRPFPRVTIDEALRIPYVIKDLNGGNAWATGEVAKAVKLSRKGPDFFYRAAASRTFGLTEGTRDSPEIKLTDFGRRLVYAPDNEAERVMLREGFRNVPIFQEVLEHYGGSNLPEMTYLANVLEDKFKLPREYHEEFAGLFRKNCDFLKIAPDHKSSTNGAAGAMDVRQTNSQGSPDVVTVAEPPSESALTCFVIMPFKERDPTHPPGFFIEVLNRIVAPAAATSGFRVLTAKRKGSDVIQATIVNGVLDADLVIADLTEHNPNVLMELGMRMAEDKPVALIKAEGTPAVFDVDNMLRVESYSPNLWPSTVERDFPRIAQHIREAWETRDTSPSFLKILRKHGATME